MTPTDDEGNEDIINQEANKVDTTAATTTGSDEGEEKNDNGISATATMTGSTLAEETTDDAIEETKVDGGDANALTADGTEGDTTTADAIKGDEAADTSTEKAVEETTASSKEGEAGAGAGTSEVKAKTKRRRKKASADDDSDEYVDEEDFDTDADDDADYEEEDIHINAGEEEVFAVVVAAAAPSTTRKARKSTPNYQEAGTDDEFDVGDDYIPDGVEMTATPGMYQPKRRKGRPRKEPVFIPKVSVVTDINISEATGAADLSTIAITSRPGISTSSASIPSPTFGGSNSVKKRRRGRPTNAERLAAGGLEVEGKKKKRPRRKLKPGSKVELVEELVLTEGDGGSKTMTVKKVVPPKKKRKSSAAKLEGNGEDGKGANGDAEAIGEDGLPVKKVRGPGRPRKDPSLSDQPPVRKLKKREEDGGDEQKKETPSEVEKSCP